MIPTVVIRGWSEGKLSDNAVFGTERDPNREHAPHRYTVTDLAIVALLDALASVSGTSNIKP